MRSVTLELHDLEPELDEFRDAVLAGLANERKSLPCKFFYDSHGSGLFEAICRLDEYYPTRTEIGILEQCAREIADLVDAPCLLVEYGSGSSAKVRILLDHLDLAAYMPVDISKSHLVSASHRLRQAYPGLDVVAICADYSQPFDIPTEGMGGNLRKVGFFPGSSIGNFSRPEAGDFLRNVASNLATGDGFIIGVDLKKDIDVLHAAYNDTQGVTAAFNLNLLARINRELGGNFDLNAFRHRAFYSPEFGRIEMHLESTRDQRVRVAGRTFRCRAGEWIHTENSYKYDVAEFQELARAAGLSPIRVWTDPNDWFSVHYLRRH